MFEPLGTQLLGRGVGRHTRWADTCWADTLGVWILDLGFLIFDLGFWWILVKHVVGDFLGKERRVWNGFPIVM